jgi:quercetin dioxygenase-like cupin family protein
MPVPPRVLVRGEQTGMRISLSETTMPPGAAGPPLHTHAFDETFYVVDGELTVQVGDDLMIVAAGQAAFAAAGTPHTLANRSATPTRVLIICAPAGFEREFARRAARLTGTQPPAWAMQPIPEVTVTGPRIGER